MVGHIIEVEGDDIFAEIQVDVGQGVVLPGEAHRVVTAAQLRYLVAPAVVEDEVETRAVGDRRAVGQGHLPAPHTIAGIRQVLHIRGAPAMDGASGHRAGCDGDYGEGCGVEVDTHDRELLGFHDVAVIRASLKLPLRGHAIAQRLIL